MTVVPFKRPETRKETAPPPVRRGTVAEFAVAMAMIGLAFFLLPTMWSSAPQMLLAVIHLLVAVVYFQQGPRIAAGVWIGLTLGLLLLTGAPSPVTYALAFAARSFEGLVP